MCLYKPDRCYLLTCGHFPRTRVSIQRYSTCLYLLTLLRNVKGTNIGDSSPRVTEKKTIKKMTNRKETANPSSEKMTTAARVIGLKGMPIGKTLVGSLLQPRDHRETRKKRYFKIVPICLNLSINPTKRSSIYGNHGNQASSYRSSR